MSDLQYINNLTYDPATVQPMRDQMTAVGFKELETPDDVDKILDRKDGKSVFLFINSVCGCAAGNARPSIMLALKHHKTPDVLATVFAGQEKEAVEYIRQKYLSDYLPSSPFMVLFKQGRLVYCMQRSEMENQHSEKIANRLKRVFGQYC